MKKLINFFGFLKFPFFKRKNLNGKVFYRFKHEVKVGDIVLSKSKGFFINGLNPSKPYKHGGIVTRVTTSRVWVTEATTKGVKNSTLFDFFEDKTDICILRHINAEHRRDELLEVCKVADSLENCQYDFHFSSGNNKYYCFELIAKAYKHIRIIFPLFDSFGSKRYLAQSFLEHEDFIEVYKASTKE
jgi:hypothetical protein